MIIGNILPDINLQHNVLVFKSLYADNSDKTVNAMGYRRTDNFGFDKYNSYIGKGHTFSYRHTIRHNRVV